MTADLHTATNVELVRELEKRGFVLDERRGLESLLQFQRDLIADLKEATPLEFEDASECIHWGASRIVAERHNPEGTVDCIVLDIAYSDEDRTAVITPGALLHQEGEKSWINFSEQRDGSMSAVYSEMLELQKKLIAKTVAFGKTEGVDFAIGRAKTQNHEPLIEGGIDAERIGDTVPEPSYQSSSTPRRRRPVCGDGQMKLWKPFVLLISKLLRKRSTNWFSI